MHVRRAGPRDYETFAQIVADVAQEGEWILTEPPVDVASRAARIAAEVESGDMAAFLLEDEGRAIGNLGLHRSPARGVVSVGVTIVAGHRGRGGGRALMETGLEEARRWGAHKVELEVFPENGRAVALYARLGFAIEGVRRDHHRRRDGSLRSTLLMALLLPVSQ